MSVLLHKKVLWYAGMVICAVIAFWSLNYVGFLAMESGRTYANLTVIRERYHLMLAVLLVSILGAIICFVKARRSRPKSPD